MMRSFRFWCLLGATFSFLTAVAHVFGGGPEFHQPALDSALSADWKVVFSTVWHEITVLLVLNGLALVCAAVALRKNTLILWLIFLLNLSFGVLFFGYGLARLETVFVLLQWLAFAAISASVWLAIMRKDNLQCVEETESRSDHFSVLPAANFADTYVVHGTEFTAAIDAARRVFGQMPNWILKLMRLRNALVKPFGLINEAPQTPEVVGMFPILLDTKDQVVLGFDDKHLDFRIIVELFNAGNSLSMTTVVKPNNLFGKAYLSVIMPLHRIIAATILAQAASPLLLSKD